MHTSQRDTDSSFLGLRGRWRIVAHLGICWAVLTGGALRVLAGDPTPPPLATPPPHDDRFTFAYETAVNFGINNPNHYVINPHILSLRWQPYHTEQFFHTDFTFARQFEINAVAVPFWHGPEQHYFGGGVGTRLVYGKTGSHFSVWFEGRLVVGAIDSSGPPYGQGEDLTFSPMGSGGVMYEVTGRQKISLGVLYEHFSNAGLSEPEKPNIGLNTIGPLFEWNISF